MRHAPISSMSSRTVEAIALFRSWKTFQRAANEAVRHQIMLYKEDADDFLDGLRKAIDALMDSD